MTDRIRKVLDDLKARQDAGEHMPCPRCGRDTMKENIHTNALSRHADIYICDACGTEEALLKFMQNWDALEHLPDEKWFGQTALPREISLRGGRLYQQPIREIKALRKSTVTHTGVTVGGRTELPGVCGRYADMELALSDQYESFTVNLAEGDGMKMTLTWEPKKQMLILDRRSSGTRRTFVHKRRCVVDTCGQEIRLRVILDRNSVEVFASEGEKTMSMVLHTPLTASGISFEAEGSAVMDVVLHELEH